MLTVTYHLEEVSEQLLQLIERIEDRAAVHAIIGEVLLDQHRDRFEQEITPEGEKWPELAPLTLLLRTVKTGKLRVTGELFRSIHKVTSAANAQVGTNLNHPKVWTHQFGATIKPIRGPFLIVPGKKGIGPTFLKSAVIPARRYIGIGPEDEPLIIEALTDYLEG